MSTIFISDDDRHKDFVEEDFTHKEINGGLYELLNTREIGIKIAYEFFDDEEATQFDIDEAINEELSGIHEKIIEAAIQVLNNNGIEVE